jgi:hypothetical protein
MVAELVVNNLVKVHTPSTRKHPVVCTFRWVASRHPSWRKRSCQRYGSSPLILPNPLFNYLQNYISYAAAVLKQKLPLTAHKHEPIQVYKMSHTEYCIYSLKRSVWRKIWLTWRSSLNENMLAGYTSTSNGTAAKHHTRVTAYSEEDITPRRNSHELTECTKAITMGLRGCW